MYDFTFVYQRGDVSRARPLIKAFVKIPDKVDSINGLKFIYDNLVQLNQLQTHEAFQLYKELQKYPSEFHSCKSYNAIKTSIQKCISTIRQSASKKCRIINMYYQEPLIVVEHLHLDPEESDARRQALDHLD
jgi:hypothetical protein